MLMIGSLVILSAIISAMWSKKSVEKFYTRLSAHEDDPALTAFCTHEMQASKTFINYLATAIILVAIILMVANSGL